MSISGIIPVYAQTLINGKLVIDNFTIYDRPNSSIFMTKVTFTNQGTQPLFIVNTDFFLFDSNNARYATTIGSNYLSESDFSYIATHCQLTGFDLNPNIPTDLKLCFDIPKDKQDFTTLEFFDNIYPPCNTNGCYLMTDIKTNNPVIAQTTTNPTIVNSTTPSKLPAWVRSDFKLYADDQISEDELLNAIRYLVQQGIIKLS